MPHASLRERRYPGGVRKPYAEGATCGTKPYRNRLDGAAVEVATSDYWGARTERSLHNFDIGRNTFVWGRPMVRALGILRKAAALASAELGELPADIADFIGAGR